MPVHYRQGDSLPLKGDSLRIPPGPQKGLPSSAVVIGDTCDKKFLDHMLLIMTSPLSFFYHMFLAMKSPLSFLYKCILTRLLIDGATYGLFLPHLLQTYSKNTQ